MRQDWFRLVDGKAVLPWKEWEACLKDTEDLKASERLGTKAFRLAQGAKVAEVRRSDERLTEAFAHLLHHGFDEVDERMMAHLVKSFEGREGTVEPRFWESPAHRLASYRTIMSRQNAKLGPTFIFAGLADDMDQSLRLNLLRVNWVCALGSGERLPYSKSQIDSKGKAWPVSYALQGIGTLLAQGRPEFLGKGETASLEHLLKSVGGIGAPELSPDGVLDLARAADLGTDPEGDLVVFWPMGKEERVDKRRLRSWYEESFRLGSLLIAFKVMMLAHVSGRARGLSPSVVMLGD